MKKPLISIIVPIFNTGKSATHVLINLFNQDYPNLEIICVNDGSTDDSLDILANFIKAQKSAKEKQRTFILIDQKNAGASAARNTGLAKASGEFILFVDSDDDVRLTFVSRLHEAITSDNNDLAICGVMYYKVKEKLYHRESIQPLPQKSENESKPAYILRLLATDGRFYAVTNKMYRATIIQQHQLKFKVGVDFAEDTDFNLAYMKVAEGGIGFALKALYQYNFGTETSTIKKSAVKRENWQRSFKDLNEWVKSYYPNQEIPEPERKWLKKIRKNWQKSHAKSVLGSDLTRTEKLKTADPMTFLSIALMERLRHYRSQARNAIRQKLHGKKPDLEDED